MQKIQLNPALFDLPSEEIQNYGLENLIYGSLTVKGLRTMIQTIQKFIHGDIYGLDLGCGDGELVYHLGKNLGIWEGVEISEHRISIQTRDVCIWQGDFLLENFRPYNVLHADNLCLEDPIAEALEEKIAIEFNGLYITYRRPTCRIFLRRAQHLCSVLTETTWTDHMIHYWWV